LPESNLPTIPSSNPVIDELLDQGVEAYRNPNSSKINAISVWQEALRAAESCGDLIRESNALSNIGCASRMIGRFPASLSYLALAWYKACSYAVRATTAVPDSVAIDVIRQSLNNDLVSVDSGASHLPGRTSDEISPTDWTFANGPSLVIWFTRLVINLGHANLSVGRVDLAAEWYQAGIRLCENTLLRYPVPAQDSSANSRIQLKFKGMRDTATMSYLHKSTLLSYVRALAHRGLCHAAAGQTSEAIDKQNLALFILSLHGPYLGDPESTYKAAIEANLGNIHHTQGRLGAAVAHHARSAMLFLQIDDLNAHARELGNLGALWIEIGKSLRELEWVRESNPTFALALDQVNGSTSGENRVLKRRRKANRNDLESDPSGQFKVARDFEKRPGSELDINLKAGDWVTIIMLMDDGVSVLGQKDEQQGTFLIDCIEIEEEVILPMPSSRSNGAQVTYNELSDALSQLKSFTNTAPKLNDGKRKVVDSMHCGTSYVEFGLGILKDVLNLGVETAELAINIGKFASSLLTGGIGVCAANCFELTR
jgi:tetratricopeptide (TPR) repeat protein